MLSFFTANATTTVLVPAGTNWFYLDDGSDQGTAWIPIAFDHSSWSNGPAQLGYGDGDEATVVSFGGVSSNKHITTYFRHSFVVSNAPAFTNLLLDVQRDDGVVVHLNGSEVFRDSMPTGTIGFDTTANVTAGGADETTFYQTNITTPLLLEGTNVLAVEIHQANSTSSDISFDLSFVHEFVDTPPTVNITAPANDTQLPVTPGDISITATASDPDGTVTSVEFYENESLLGNDLTTPYELTWVGATIGLHTLTCIAYDNAGNATTSAPVNITIGNPGFALQFDGNNDYVTFGAAPGLGASTLTIEAWVQRTGSGVSVTTGGGGVTAVPIVTKGRGEQDGTNKDLNYFFGINASLNVLAADFEEGAGGSAPGLNHPISGITPLSLNVWYHAAVTYDGSTWRLYLDGILENELTVGQPLRFDSIQHAALGTALNSLGQPVGYFDGILDEVRIWDHARTITEIAQDMDKEITSAPGLLGRWGLNEGSGLSAGDSSGSFITGTLVNGPTWTTGLSFTTPPIISITTPTNTTAFSAPAEITLKVSVADDSGVVTNVSYFAGTTQLLETNVAPFSATWTNVTQGHYSLTAIAQSNTGLNSTSSPVTIVVENEIVQITSPTNNARLITPIDVVIDADATPTNGTITLVEFYYDATKLGEDTTAPYSYTWSSTLLASYLLTAVATGSGGILHTSVPISIIVATNLPPAVSVTTPTNSASFNGAPVNIPISVSASDSDGTVTQVEFFEGINSLGVDTTPPFDITWNSVGVGNYSLTAVATDDLGATNTSSSVDIVVTEANLTRGPYLQLGTTNSAIVRWRTDAATVSRVRYGPAPDNLPNIVDDLTLTTEHSVTVTGLTADTKYYYSIGTTNGSIVIDTNFFFTTSPDIGTPDPTRIWVLGDSGTANADARNVRDGYLNFAGNTRRSDMILMLGDNAYDTGTDAEYQAAVFDTYRTVLKNTFLYPTIGNHDSVAAGFPYLEIFDLPVNAEGGGLASGTERYYSFDYANIHFICLDSETSSRATNGAMVTWLVNDMAATMQDWIIAFWHHPPYSHGHKNSDTEAQLIEMRENVLPFLEDGGVDLVMSGHSHSYERSYLLHGHYDYSSTFNSTYMKDGGSGREDDTGAYLKPELDGAVYIVAGSSGKISGGTLDHPAHYFSVNLLGSMVLDVESNRLDAVFLDTNGAERDYFTIRKGDSQINPPATPANLISTLPGSNDIKLVWSNNATNEAGYRIERSSDNVNFTQIGDVGANLLSYFDTGLAPGTTWFYRVRSFNNAGESEPSNITSETTSGPPILIALNSPPDALTNVGEFITLDVTPTDPQSDDLTVRFFGREVGAPEFSGIGTNATITSGNNTTLTWTNLTSSTDYEWFIAVTDGTQAAVSPSRQFSTLPNFPPFVSIRNPTNGAGFFEGTNITIDATASDPDGTITKIEFFEGTTLLGEDLTSPFSFEWLGPGIGPYSLTAVVTDNVGATNISPAADILVTNDTFLLPEITTQPQGQLVQQGSNATFTVVATGSGTLTYQWKLEGTYLPNATNSTLTITDSQPADAGNYSVVVDNTFSTTSTPALLEVNQPPAPGSHVFQRYVDSDLKMLLTTLTGTDPNLDALSFTALGPLTDQGGTISTNGAWLFYEPAAGFNNSDSFTYTVDDGRGGSTDGTVTINIASDDSPSQNHTVNDLENGSFEIVFAGVPARTYRIQYTDDLQSPDWQDLTTEVADSLGQYNYVETPPGGTITRFYRSIEP